MKKELFKTGIVALFVLASKITFVWAIIEFILYLVKDKAFNWWSVYLFCISVVIAFSVGINVIIGSKNKEVAIPKIKTRWDRKVEELKAKK